MKDMNKIRFGLVIQLLRTDRGLSQRELAKKIGVSQGEVSIWEQGVMYPLSTNLKVLIDFFNCPYLMELIK